MINGNRKVNQHHMGLKAPKGPRRRLEGTTQRVEQSRCPWKPLFSVPYLHPLPSLFRSNQTKQQPKPIKHHPNPPKQTPRKTQQDIYPQLPPRHTGTTMDPDWRERITFDPQTLVGITTSTEQGGTQLEPSPSTSFSSSSGIRLTLSTYTKKGSEKPKHGESKY